MRSKACLCYSKVFSKGKSIIGRIREIDKVLNALSDYSSDGSLNVRSAAR